LIAAQICQLNGIHNFIVSIPCLGAIASYNKCQYFLSQKLKIKYTRIFVWNIQICNINIMQEIMRNNHCVACCPDQTACGGIESGMVVFGPIIGDLWEI
jgi:hypothetical protein